MNSNDQNRDAPTGGMFAPPSLPGVIVDRSFVARNREFGIQISDTGAFLDSCEADCVDLLGWELWLIDHSVGTAGLPVLSPGNWSGLIPTIGSPLPGVFGCSGDSKEIRQQLAATNFDELIEHSWLPFVRVNFTLGKVRRAAP